MWLQYTQRWQKNILYIYLVTLDDDADAKWNANAAWAHLILFGQVCKENTGGVGKRSSVSIMDPDFSFLPPMLGMKNCALHKAAIRIWCGFELSYILEYFRCGELINSYLVDTCLANKRYWTLDNYVCLALGAKLNIFLFISCLCNKSHITILLNTVNIMVDFQLTILAYLLMKILADFLFACCKLTLRGGGVTHTHHHITEGPLPNCDQNKQINEEKNITGATGEKHFV